MNRKKQKHLFVQQATAFLALIGLKFPSCSDQFRMAAWWTSNQERIVKAIPTENERLKPHFLRMCGELSRKATYFNELKQVSN
jgi:hypothetical protein